MHNHESRPNPETVTQEELQAFFGDIKQFDEEHSQGAWLGKMLAASLFQHLDSHSSEEEGDEEKRNKPLEKLNREIEAKLTVEDLQNIHSEILAKIGLSIESPTRGEVMEEDEPYAVGEVLIHLDDSNKFVGFLKTLEAGNLSEGSIHLIDMVGQKLISQILTIYNLDTPDEEFLTLYSSIDTLANEINRLGREKLATDIRQYLKYGKQHCLKEFVLARNNHIFQPIGTGFNLSTFQRDNNYEGYMRDWERRGFSTLEAIMKNKNAGELYEEATRYLVECITFAENDEFLTKQDDEHSRELKRAIQDTKEKLSHYTDF